MSRLNYTPSLAAVFLDQETISFLEQNFDVFLWKKFFYKINEFCKDLPVYITTSAKLQLNLESLLSEFPYLTFDTETNSEATFLSKLAITLPPSRFNDPDWDEVCILYFKGIAPLLDHSLMMESWDRHKKFFSQYSYSENLPEGIIPTIITREFLSTLPDKLTTDVHSFFLKNINQYDVDIFFVPPDLRQYRFDFRLNNFRNAKLISNLLKLNENIKYEEILPTIQQSPNLYRSSPSYIEWEIYKGCELSCVFCPRQLIDKEDEPISLSTKNVKLITEQFDKFLTSPFTICLGGNGEPLLHKEINEIILSLLSLNHLQELIIESALYQNVDPFIEFLVSLTESQKSKLCIIINMTTLKADTYKKLYGKDHHTQILKNIERLKEVLPPSSLHVQMIKMIEVGDEVESFFTFFEKKGINVILQKYNTFAGKLPEKRVSDLTPIHRDFCWHLNRDLVIDSKGNVQICKQSSKEILGNLFTEDLSSIWERGHAFFSDSLHGNHDKIPAPCLNCDEWYTFNA